ncbi:hypothetical protein Dimus_030360 [Dionaea muscipula]
MILYDTPGVIEKKMHKLDSMMMKNVRRATLDADCITVVWYEKFTNVDDVIAVSAKYGQGVDDIKELILSKLPISPAYYPKRYTEQGQFPDTEGHRYELPFEHHL